MQGDKQNSCKNACEREVAPSCENIKPQTFKAPVQ